MSSSQNFSSRQCFKTSYFLCSFCYIAQLLKFQRSIFYHFIISAILELIVLSQPKKFYSINETCSSEYALCTFGINWNLFAVSAAQTTKAPQVLPSDAFAVWVIYFSKRKLHCDEDKLQAE